MRKIIYPLIGSIFTKLVDLLIQRGVIKWDFFTNIASDKISLNIFEIISILLALYLIHLIINKQVIQLILVRRAIQFHKNWMNFKSILVKHRKNKEKDFQKEYSKARIKLANSFNYFSEDIYNNPYYTSSKDQNRHNSILRNFEFTFFPQRISGWSMKVQRRIPDELDCFDDICIRLKENLRRRLIKQ